MDNKNTLTSASLIPLGIGIAIGGSILFALIELWPLLVLSAAGYCIYKGFVSTPAGTTGAKDAE